MPAPCSGKFGVQPPLPRAVSAWVTPQRTRLPQNQHCRSWGGMEAPNHIPSTATPSLTGDPQTPSAAWRGICVLELIYFPFSHIFLAPPPLAAPSQLPANEPRRDSLAVISNVSAGKWQSRVEVAFP